MKNILIITICFLIFSCKKQDNVTPALNEASIQVLKTNNQDLQRSMFRLLTPDEKANVWINKYNEYLKISKLSESQAIFIKSLIDIIKPEMYINSEKYFLSINEPLLKEQAIKLFGFKGAKSLLTTLSRWIEDEEVDDETGGGGGGVGCSCNKKDDWCSPMKCSTWECNPTLDGCGWWLSKKCNGKCF